VRYHYGKNLERNGIANELPNSAVEASLEREGFPEADGRV
jgi:hypothetical protein